MANRKKQKQILALLLGGILLGSAAGCGELKGQEPSGKRLHCESIRVLKIRDCTVSQFTGICL